MKRLLLVALLVGLCGCGTLIPKKVELFQDKVKSVPVAKASEREIQRQAAFMASQLSLKTAVSLIGENSPLSKDASDTALLTGAISESLGPPLRPSNDPAAELAAELRRTIARLNERLDDFRQGNNENVGKKIEGTGLIQVPYVLWAGGFVVMLFIGYVLLKIAVGIASAMNPGVAFGRNAVQFGARGLAKAFSQVVKGGQDFKKALDQKIDDPALRQQVLDLFVSSQKQAQDEDAKAAIKHLIQE
jgi:hypothetical protein